MRIEAKFPAYGTAIRFTGDNLKAITEFIEGTNGLAAGGSSSMLTITTSPHADEPVIDVESRELKDITVATGDWIIKSEDGVLYSMTATAFSSWYREAQVSH